MSNFTLFVCGLAITLISGMGVAISQIHIGYKNLKNKNQKYDQLDFEILKKEDYA